MSLNRPQDLVKETASHFKKAKKFYDGVAAQLVKQGHALDVFACSLDQVCVSLPEMPFRRHAFWVALNISEDKNLLLSGTLVVHL